MTFMPDFALDTLAAAGSEKAPVVLLHDSADSSAGWIGLTEHIEGRFRVHAPDLPGHGADRAPVPEHPGSLQDRAERVVRQIAGQNGPVHLVGHGFGAVLALRIAADHPGLVCSLTLIEPTAFNVFLPGTVGQGRARAGLSGLIHAMRVRLAAGDARNAMREFVDFHHGAGSWERTAQGHRQELARHAGAALSDLIALDADRMTPVDLAGVVCPALLVTGAETGRHLKAIAGHLHRALPFAQRHDLDGAGHMPHRTDPHVADPMIADFLVRAEGRWQDSRTIGRKAA